MQKQFRRVVTGHDANGKAVVLSDGPAPFVHVNPNEPEWYSADIWRTTETPARIAAAAPEPTLGPRRQMPAKHGSVIRINHFPPEPEAVRQMTPEEFAQGVRLAGQRKGLDLRQGRPASADASH